MTDLFTIAANRGELGGGEVMLLQLADAARALGLATRVVAPRTPAETADAAHDAGHGVVALPCRSRRDYARALRSWDRDRRGLLWCNGLLPALATAGHRDRVVHLHQAPTGAQSWACRLAVAGAVTTVVPSVSMGRTVPHDVVLPNWTGDIATLPEPTGRQVVGYLGRLQSDKGVDVLADAVRGLRDTGRELRLLVAGDHGFGDAADRRRVDAALAGLGDAVELLGRVPREELLASVDLAVFPSVWSEPFGLVVAEAMASGVPFVISDAGALSEVAGPEHPWVARAGDTADLARVIEEALGCEPARRREVVAEARRRWEQEFSPTAGGRRFADVLRRVGYRLPSGARP
ncbi:glycosyltransferase [Nocardioides mangrovicus]|uniref:Glycosyltransferase n=1 Tax=Nocardioides mangrovicus TaxID=2478913 RepID=A0A3L8NWW1_9ACTN|nr:glycosyltransferase family 4 protein [Nocardioides mangrovicus]RLV47640.1 glycosyltransferase [Nocardioides mangrovicus]